jgi:hypothetical protein
LRDEGKNHIFDFMLQSKPKGVVVVAILIAVILQGVRQELVHLGNASRDAEVNGSVANLDDEAANDLRVNLVGDLELLALADVGGLGDGSLEAVEGLVVEGLWNR